MCLIHSYLLYLFFRSFYFRWKCSVRHRFNVFYHIGNCVCICYNYFPCLFLSQIIKLSEHFLRRSEVQRRLFFSIIKSFCIHKNFSVNRILRVYKMAVARSYYHFIMFFSEAYNFSVKIFNILN